MQQAASAVSIVTTPVNTNLTAMYIVLLFTELYHNVSLYKKYSYVVTTCYCDITMWLLPTMTPSLSKFNVFTVILLALVKNIVTIATIC